MANVDGSGFEKFGFNKQLNDALAAAAWREPTPIQALAIPIAKSGKDVLGLAQTGTGKTAAYLLPLISKLGYAQGQHTRAVILAPTKELAKQISLHFEALNTTVGLRYTLLIGGVGMQPQLASLVAGNDLVIATPGRFLEMFATNQWKTKEIKTLVIDEADRMMDMGFMPQIRKILEKIPSKRQNLLFSATFPEKVESLAAEFLEFPERVEAAPHSTTAATIAQSCYKTPNFQTKLNLLLWLLRNIEASDAAMVFVKTKKHATDIGKFLDRKLEHPVAFLHANKGTNTRSYALEQLHDGSVKILVTTDVAARGLDISRVSLVINFDLPIQYEEYVHRVGRTGRASRLGTAISFVSPPDELHLERIESLIRMKVPVKQVPEKLLETQTGFEEQQEILRKIDDQRKKADPTFKGAFHEKKAKNVAKPAEKKGSSGKSGLPKPGQSSSKPRGKKFSASGKGTTDRRPPKRRG